MFVIVPWKVDVPQVRWPVMNWLIIAATIFVFYLQIPDLIKYRKSQNPNIHNVYGQKKQEIQGITGTLMLNGWSLKGLFGYMWLHGGFLHLLGNMLFLWIFGNAVCAKIGNLKYLVFYVFFGVFAGGAHLLLSSGDAVGASGAINGVVAMYLVLYFENEITCYYWFLIIIRRFAVRSGWVILFWLFWDIVGAFSGSGLRVGYFAHLGGFAAGFATAFIMCKTGWVTMERYEKSLLQIWQEIRRSK